MTKGNSEYGLSSFKKELCKEQLQNISFCVPWKTESYMGLEGHENGVIITSPSLLNEVKKKIV